MSMGGRKPESSRANEDGFSVDVITALAGDGLMRISEMGDELARANRASPLLLNRHDAAG